MIAVGPVVPGNCSSEGSTILASQPEFDALLREVGATAVNGDAGSLLVDFAQERVILRHGRPDEGVVWMALEESQATLGVLGCVNPVPEPGCVARFYRVAGTPTEADTRTCDPVGCSGSAR